MATFTTYLTGPGETDRFGFLGTDLGFTARTNHGYCISIFGDTFDTAEPGSQGWRCPVGLRQSNADIENGIRWDNCIGGDRAKEMVPYTHYDEQTARDTVGLPVTEIPNDLIQLPDGRYMMTTFGVRDWAVPPNGVASPGGSWRTWYSRMWTSTETNAEFWGPTYNLETNRLNMDFWNYGDLWSHFQNNSMVMWPGEPFVYIYGTNEGRWNGGGIHLMRVPWDHMWHPSWYRFWGCDSAGVWDWRPTGPSTPILLPIIGGTAIGEVSVQVVEGMVVLSYCDGTLGATTRTAPYPTGLWSLPKVQITPPMAPNLYAPVVHPYSTLNRTQWLVSQWITDVDGRTTTYGVRQWSGAIEGLSFVTGGSAETLVVTEHAAALPGHRGPLSPCLTDLPVAEQISILHDGSDGEVARADLDAAFAEPVQR